MKLATIKKEDGTQAVCAVDTARGELLDLKAAARAVSLPDTVGSVGTMLDLIDSGSRGLDTARTLVERWPEGAILRLAGANLMSPLPVPRQIRDCLVFEEHLTNVMAQWVRMTGKPALPIPDAWYRRPTYYKGNIYSVVGHDTDVIWPDYSTQMDYELELAAVTGKAGKNVPLEKAAEHIFGYTIFNDFSARDMQVIERPFGMGPMKSKDFDTGNVIGPWIVTVDEIGDPQALDMEVRLNGQRVGGGSSSKMQHSFEKIFSFMTMGETVYPGTVIASGTVGTGCGLERGQFLNPGDVIELEVERIGVLRNRIVKSN